jgi:hypothetical protein
MFVGCSALSFCPRRLLAPDGAAPPAGGDGSPGVPEYRSPFRTWYERAGVRQAERRVLSEGAGDVNAFFSPDLVPLARHPLVRALPDQVFDELLIQHLYRYLDFTAKLETLVVNRTILGIAHGTVGVELPEEMRFDAFKMYCDEAYHALFSVDLARQVTARTGVRPRLPAEPFFLRRLRQIQEELPPADRPLAELLFVVVSETLISAYLADVPEAQDVEPAVREMIRDHAIDEGRHHAFFAVFLRFLWARLDPDERRRAAVLAPRLIDAFLRPDLDAIRLELAGYGLSRSAAEQITGEVYTPDVVREHVRGTARQTVRYLLALDVLDDPRAAEEFHRFGLLDAPDDSTMVSSAAGSGAPPPDRP